MTVPRAWFIVIATLCLAGAAATELARGVQFGMSSMVFMDMSSRWRQEGVLTDAQWSSLCNDAAPSIGRLTGLTRGITFLWLLVAGLSAIAAVWGCPVARSRTGSSDAA